VSWGPLSLLCGFCFVTLPFGAHVEAGAANIRTELLAGSFTDQNSVAAPAFANSAHADFLERQQEEGGAHIRAEHSED
jgi:hypothetical protein